MHLSFDAELGRVELRAETPAEAYWLRALQEDMQKMDYDCRASTSDGECVLHIPACKRTMVQKFAEVVAQNIEIGGLQ